MAFKYFICFVISIPFVVGKGVILKSSIITYPEGQFLNYVQFNDGEIVKTCELEYTYENGTKNKLHLDIHSTSSIYDPMIFLNRLSNIGRGLCGVKVRDVKLSDPRDYSFIVQTTLNTNKSIYHFWTSFYDFNKFVDETYYVKLGGRQQINCGVLRQLACRLYNPKGELVIDREKCSKYVVEYITIEDIGRWRCEIVLVNQMEVAVENFDFKLRTDRFQVETWYKEKEGLGMVGCKYITVENIEPPVYCTLVAPNLKYFHIKTGSLTSRYTTIGTNLNSFTCQMEMPLPLLESEKGIWKCKILESGGYINIGDVTLPEYSTRKEVLDTSRALNIRCQIPYSTDNCFLQAPNGDIYTSDKSLGLGICSKTFDDLASSVTRYFTGTWHCHFSNPQKSSDDVIDVEVYSVTSVNALKNIEVTEGESAELICNRSLPIRSCRFIDPQGVTYHLSPKKKDSAVKYVGRGFEKGDCGINIKSVAGYQSGIWTCLVQGANSSEIQEELISTVTLAVYGGQISLAGVSLGIPIGIGLASILLLAFSIYAFYKRHPKRQEENQRRSSQTSNDSGNSNAMINATNTRRYDTAAEETTSFF